MKNAKYTTSRHLRVLEVPVTDHDLDTEPLVELPAGSVLDIWVSVEDAFAAGAHLDIGTKSDGDAVVADQDIDGLGYFHCTLLSRLSSTSAFKLYCSVSDKTAAGRLTIIVLFSMLKDTKVD
jgi:hypothetical protein